MTKDERRPPKAGARVDRARTVAAPTDTPGSWMAEMDRLRAGLAHHFPDAFGKDHWLAEEIAARWATPIAADLDEKIRLLSPYQVRELADVLAAPNGRVPSAVEPLELRIVTAEEFAAVAEPGTESLLGAPGDALIPANGDVMIWGDGGTAKTTLSVALAAHLAAGQDWLGIPVGAPLRVLIVELEGPRPKFREKIDAKIKAWAGPPLERLWVLEEPWAKLSLAVEQHRQVLADAIARLAVDVVFLGPITAGGMDEAGTLQEVRDFVALIHDVRAGAKRLVTFVLVHHAAKGGKVSGSWEGAVDTLFHVSGLGHGRTRLHVQKSRWSSTHHARTWDLRWIPGEEFEVDDKPELDDDSIAEMLLAAIAGEPGIGWSAVEERTPGMRRERRRVVRDRLLSDGTILNLARTEGEDVLLDHCPPGKRSRLFPGDDPALSQLRPEPGAVGAQSAPAAGGSAEAQPRPAPRPIGAQGAGAQFPPDPDVMFE